MMIFYIYKPRAWEAEARGQIIALQFEDRQGFIKQKK